MRIKKFGMAMLAVVLMLGLCACDGNDRQDAADNNKKEIRIACMETSEALVDFVSPLMEEKGYTLEYQVFGDNVDMISAADDGSIDGVLVYKPFMERCNSVNNGDLVMLQPYVYTSYIDLLSEKYDSLGEIPETCSAVLAVKAENENAQWAIELNKAFLAEETKVFVQEYYVDLYGRL